MREKSITGKFKPKWTATTKDFATHLIGLSRPYTYSVSANTGDETITIKFDTDEDFENTCATFDKMERDNNPQGSLFGETEVEVDYPEEDEE